MTGGAPGIWISDSTTLQGPSRTISLARPAGSIVATNSTLYAILAGGSVGQLDATSTYQPIQMEIQNPLTPDNPPTYTAAAPVPTVTSI
jgi:hypothetical protein